MDAIWAIDLAEMGEWVDNNNGYKYILCAIDLYTRYAWCEALKSKRADETWRAISSVFERAGVKPKKLWADQGSEWRNATWNRELKKNSIKLYHTYGTHKASMVERFNRTLKETLWYHFIEAGTRKWTDVLQDEVQQYNEREHRSISMTPAHARTKEGSDTLREHYLLRSERAAEADAAAPPPRYSVGQWVHVSRIKEVFEKGFHPRWSAAQFQIRAVKPGAPPLCYLRDYDGEPVEGAFYEAADRPVVKPQR